MFERSDKCTTRRINCGQTERLPAKTVSYEKVFYSFPFIALSNIRGRALKQALQVLLKEDGLEMDDFREEQLSAESYFCENICRKIKASPFIIADISYYMGNKPSSEGRPSENVTHEIGLAQGLGKAVILVTVLDENNIPSNLRGTTVWAFPWDEETRKGYKKLIHDLRVRAFPEICTIDDPLDFQKMALRLEGLPGEWLSVSNVLPSLMRRDKMPKERAKEIYRHLLDQIADKEERDRYISEYTDTVLARSKQFDEQVKNYRHRDIFSKKDIEKYITQGIVRRSINSEKPTNDPKEEVSERVETLLARLDHSKYEIGLIEDPIVRRQKFLIKVNCGLIIDSPGRHHEPYAGGVFSTIGGFVRKHQKKFEKLWSALAPQDKEKESVRQFFQDRLPK